MATHKKISPTSAMHIFKLCFRSALLLTAFALYLVGRIQKTDSLFGGYENKPIFLFCLWIIFVIEMILRFFPARIESMGCQKQFSRNYKPLPASSPSTYPATSAASVLAVGAAWILLNGAIGVIYWLGWIDKGILLLISLAYSVCDMICILFFCPFQTWFMKNKCCVSCRIYNWDYAMMFTPLIFIKNPFTWSLFVLAFALFLQWEILAHRHPERFSDTTNACLSCGACKEKLCSHKKQLRQFLKKNKDRLRLTGNRVLSGQLADLLRSSRNEKE